MWGVMPPKIASQPVMDMSWKLSTPASLLLEQRSTSEPSLSSAAGVSPSCPGCQHAWWHTVTAAFLGACPKWVAYIHIFVLGLAFGRIQPKTAATLDSGCIFALQVTESPTSTGSSRKGFFGSCIRTVQANSSGFRHHWIYFFKWCYRTLFLSFHLPALLSSTLASFSGRCSSQVQVLRKREHLPADYEHQVPRLHLIGSD